MPDLNERMRGVDHVPFPEDWDAVEGRAGSVEPIPHPAGSRALRTIVILSATLLVLGVALYGLSGLGSSTDGAGTGTTPESSSTAVYIDPAGIPITVDHPTDWFARSFTSSADGLSNGVEITNVEAIVWPKDPAGQPQPSNYVRVSISTSKQQVASSLPDSPLPLSMDDASVTLGPGNTRQLMARVGGVPFVIQVSAGPNASEADLATADAMVASIRPNGPSASPSPSAPAGAATELAVTCGPGGIEASDHLVVASPDGVHVTVSNPTSAKGMELHAVTSPPGSAFGGRASGASTWPMYPGRWEIACLDDWHQSYQDVPTATVQVTDPAGYWVTPGLDCAGPQTTTSPTGTADLANASEAELRSAAEAQLVGVQDSDRFQGAGFSGTAYKLWQYWGILLRGGQRVASVKLGYDGTWTVESCVPDVTSASS